jgi:hypothetical protein
VGNFSMTLDDIYAQRQGSLKAISCQKATSRQF